MKKLLAMLLVLLLPLTALADTYCTEATITLNEENFKTIAGPIIKALFAMDESVNDEQINAAIASLLNGLGVRIVSQDDAAKAAILLDDGELIDLTAYVTSEEVCITSELFPGYALVEELTASQMDGNANEPWSKIASASLQSTLNWVESLFCTVERGAFSGEAYTGGTICTTWKLTDNDIADLVDALLNQEFREQAEKMADASAVRQMLTAVDSANKEARTANQHAYTFRWVTDDSGAFVGASLIIQRSGVQLATVSCGVSNSSARLIIGMGHAQDNSWLDFKADGVMTEDALDIIGSVTVLSAPKDETYAYALAVSGDQPSVTNWTFHAGTSDDAVSWSYTFSGNTPAALMAYSIPDTYTFMGSGSAQIQPKIAFQHAETVSLGSMEIFTMSLNAKDTDPIPDRAADLKECSVNATDAASMELMDEILTAMETNLMVRLVKQLPMDLLFRIPNMFSIP